MKLHVVKLLILLLACSALYADGIRQSSGPVGQHTPSAGSHSRERIDGQYSAMPSGAASEVRGLVATGQVGAVVVMPGDAEEVGGSIVGPPQPMESASPEPSAWVLVAGGVLMVVLGRKEAK